MESNFYFKDIIRFFRNLQLYLTRSFEKVKIEMAIRNLIANIMHIFDRIKVSKSYKIINFEIFLEILSRYLYQEDNI